MNGYRNCHEQQGENKGEKIGWLHRQKIFCREWASIGEQWLNIHHISKTGVLEISILYVFGGLWDGSYRVIAVKAIVESEKPIPITIVAPVWPTELELAICTHIWTHAYNICIFLIYFYYCAAILCTL